MEILVRLFSALVGAVLTALVWYLIRRDNARPPGAGVLVYGPTIKLLGFAGAVIFLAAGYFTFKSTGFESITPLAIFITLVLMCVALILEAGFVRIRYNGRGVHTSSPWRPAREIPWHSITGCRWSEINKWYVLETRASGRVRLSIYLRGLPAFFSTLEEKRKEGTGWEEVK